MSMENPLNEGAPTPAGLPQPAAKSRTQAGPEMTGLPEPQAGGSTNWEALFQEERGRRQGLDRRIQEVASERDQLNQQLADMQRQLDELKKPQPQAPPVSDGKKPEAPNAEGEVHSLLQAMQGQLAQLQAAQHRDTLLREYMGPGKPGEGLDLYAYGDYIPVHPVEVDGTGKVDDSAQRQVIEGLIERLKAERGHAARVTEQSMVAGSTPGSAPSPGAPSSPQSEWEEYKQIKAEVNDTAAMAKLPPGEYQKKMDRYYKLVAKHAHRDAGFKAPWISSTQMYQMIQDLSAQVGSLTGK